MTPFVGSAFYHTMGRNQLNSVVFTHKEGRQVRPFEKKGASESGCGERMRMWLSKTHYTNIRKQPVKVHSIASAMYSWLLRLALTHCGKRERTKVCRLWCRSHFESWLLHITLCLLDSILWVFFLEFLSQIIQLLSIHTPIIHMYKHTHMCIYMYLYV